MTFTSYAQNFEDVRLWRAFHDVERGRYLDIGSQDPVRDSVSLAFYKIGWRGVHVEAVPEYADAMRRARPDEIVIAAAASSTQGLLHFWTIGGTGLSTGRLEIAERHAQAGWEIREIVVPAIPLSAIFDQMGPDLVHWMKIDVEGMEVDVLSSWGAHPARPQVLIIEATAPMTQDRTDAEWLHLVEDRGYRHVLFDGLSSYFVHESCSDRAERLSLNPNVFDDINVSWHHFTARALAGEHTALVERTANEAARLREETQQLAAVGEQARQSVVDMERRLEADAAAHSAAISNIRAVHRGQLRQAETTLEAQRHALTEMSRKFGALQGQFDAHRQHYGQLLVEANGRQADLKQETVRLHDALDHRDRQLAALIAAQDRTIAISETMQAEAARLKKHIAWREEQLHRAMELLAIFPVPVLGRSRWLTGRRAKAVEQARVEQNMAFKKALDQWRASLLFNEENKGVVAMHAGVRSYSLAELLAIHDVAFVRSAYKAILDRDADPEGELYYLTRLRSGWPKLSILMQLRSSNEGRRIAAHVPGLDRAILGFRLATLPLFGPVYRLFTGATGTNARERTIFAIANDAGAARAAVAGLAESVTDLRSQVAALADELRGLRTVQPEAREAIQAELEGRAAKELPQAAAQVHLDSSERRVLRQLSVLTFNSGAPE